MQTIRKLNPEDIPSCRALWDSRFHDSAAFTDWYFAERFIPFRSFGLFENEILLSMAHARPVRLNLPAGPETGLMIAGVSTRNGCEKHGYMHRVMNALETDAAEEGNSFLCLSPADPVIYASLGFQASVRALYTVCGTPSSVCLSASSPDAEELLRCYQTFIKPYSLSSDRDVTAMRSRAAELYSDGSVLLTVRTPTGELAGYAFYNPKSSEAEELCAVDKTSFHILLASLPCGTTAVLPADSGLSGDLRVIQMIKPLGDFSYDRFLPSFNPEII